MNTECTNTKSDQIAPDVIDFDTDDPDCQMDKVTHNGSAMVAGDNPNQRHDFFSDDVTYNYPMTVAEELREWRERWSMNTYIEKLRDDPVGHTVAHLFGGGGLSMMGSARAGFGQTWNTEIVAAKQQILEYMSHAKCYTDSFDPAVQKAPSPNLLWVTPPCIDYASSGSQLGGEGQTGWMFVEVGDVITAISPDSFIIEMSSNCTRVHDGAELTQLLQKLKQSYKWYRTVTRVWHWGDPTNRERLFIVGFHKRNPKAYSEFKWPKFVYNYGRPAPRYADIAVPDSKVPEYYTRSGPPPPLCEWREPEWGKMHKIAQVGKWNSMGYSNNPHSYYSMDSLPNGQTTFNGGGQRPSTKWRRGEPITWSRLTVIPESCALQNVPDEYPDLVTRFMTDADRSAHPNPQIAKDIWVRDLINQGVPVRTATELSTAVRKALVAAKVPICGARVAPETATDMAIQSALSAAGKAQDGAPIVCKMLVDTGCYPHSMLPEWFEPCLINPKPSDAKIVIADGSTMTPGLTGKVLCYALHGARSWDAVPNSRMAFTVTTSTHTRTGLFSPRQALDRGFKFTFEKHKSSMSKGDLTIPFIQGDDGGIYVRFAMILPKDPAAPNYLQSQQVIRYAVAEQAHLDSSYEGGVTTSSMPILSMNSSADDIIKYYATHPDVLTVCQVDASRDVIDRNSATDMALKFDDTGRWTVMLVNDSDTDCDGSEPGGSSQAANAAKKKVRRRDRRKKSKRAVESVEWNHPDADEPEGDTTPPITKEFILHHKAQRRFQPTKRGLRFGKNKEAWVRIHEDHAHMGYCEGCEICRLVMGTPRRIYVTVDPHREDRRGYAFVMDGITLSHRSFKANKYCVLLRDIATDMIFQIPLHDKDQIVEEFYDWVIELRGDKFFRGLTYQPCAVLGLDCAGEWDWDTGIWNEMAKRVLKATGQGIEMIYYDPADKRKRRAMLIERTNGIWECLVKSILMQQNLPPEAWEAAGEDAIFLCNRAAPYRSQLNLSQTGDQSSPIELFTAEGISRMQVYTELSYYCQVGTPCLVHDPKVHGSTLAPKSAWWIAWGMEGSNVRFKDPRKNVFKISKSYTSFRLRNGLNYAQWLGLGDIPSTKAAAAIRDPGLKDEGYVIDLTAFAEKYYKTGKVKPIGPAVLDYTLHGEAPDGAEPTVIKTSAPGLRGTVDIIQPGTEGAEGSEGLHVEPDNDHPDVDTPEESEKLATPSADYSLSADHDPTDSLVVDIEGTLGNATQWQDADKRQELKASKKVRSKGKVTGPTDRLESFARRTLGIAHKYVQCYIDWLLSHPYYINVDGVEARMDLEVKDGLEMGKKGVPYLPPYRFMPYPAGKRWDEFVIEKDNNKLVSQAVRQEMEEVTSLINQAAMRCKVLNQMEQLDNWRYEGQTPLIMSAIFDTDGSTIWNPEVDHTDKSTSGERSTDSSQARVTAAMKAAGKVRTKAVGAGQEPVPKDTLSAISHPTRANDWMVSLDKEFFGLVKLGVFKLGYTLSRLKELGITSKPIPIGTVFDHKYDHITAELEKLKSRMALKGHPGNMFKGEHYCDTYAATPVGDTAKVLQALMVLLKLVRKAFDIVQAYLHADMEEGYDKIILEYPVGYQEWDGDEKLYILMDKNLYGHPAGALNWGRDRDKFIMARFNTGEWVCVCCYETDPCLFHITRTVGKAKEHMWALIHTDDCDTYGQNEGILQCFRDIIHDKWGVKDVNPETQLGLQRILKVDKDSGMWECIVKMPVFVEGMHGTFCDDDHYPKKDVSTPYPGGALPDVLVNKVSVSDAETAQVKAKGYNRAVGMFLWAARHAFPESAVGASFASRTLSHPSLADWKAILHGIKWMHQERNRGIRFNSFGNRYPFITVDASNNPDSRSLSQSGHAGHWMGGTFAYQSQRNDHPDFAAPRNEYMAMKNACATAHWIRFLCDQAGFTELIPCYDGPTPIFTDSKGATDMSNKDKITRSFKLCRGMYHVARAMVRDQIVKIIHLYGRNNPSDLLTKANHRQRIAGGTPEKPEAGVMHLAGFAPLTFEGCEKYTSHWNDGEVNSGYGDFYEGDEA